MGRAAQAAPPEHHGRLKFEMIHQQVKQAALRRKLENLIKQIGARFVEILIHASRGKSLSYNRFKNSRLYREEKQGQQIWENSGGKYYKIITKLHHIIQVP